MEQSDSLAFEISRNNLSILLQRVRLSSDDSGLDVSLAGEKLILTAASGDVRAQAEATIRIVRNPQGPEIRHWEVHPDLFRRLLVSRTPQDVFRDPIAIAIPLSTPETAANDVIAKIQAGDLRLTWPFSEKAEVEFLARPATQSAAVVNGPAIADVIRRCRPYADLKHPVVGAIHIKGGVACGAQRGAARWIEAADLSNLDIALKRTDAGYVAYALSHFSARTNLLCAENHGWAWDDGAILRFPIMAAFSPGSVVQNVPESARVNAGEFMMALRKVAAQRKESEKYLALRFFGGSPSGRAVISTPVVGGEATATCKLDIVAGGKLDGPNAYVEMQLLVDHVKPLGASPSGMISLSFPKTGILFGEQHSALKIATHVANKKLEFKSIIERWNHDSAFAQKS